MSWRTWAAICLAVVGLVAGGRAVWMAVCPAPAAVPTVRRDFPIGALPKRHKASRKELLDAVRTASNVAGMPNSDGFAEATSDVVAAYATINRETYSKYLSENNIQTPKGWDDKTAEQRFQQQFATANKLDFGSKSVIVRPRYLQGRPQTVRGVTSECMIFGGPARHHGLPEISPGMLDIYEVVIPAYGIQSFGGTVITRTLEGRESSRQTNDDDFDAAIGLWFTRFGDKWHHIAISVYGARGRVVALPLM